MVSLQIKNQLRNCFKKKADHLLPVPRKILKSKSGSKISDEMSRKTVVKQDLLSKTQQLFDWRLLLKQVYG